MRLLSRVFVLHRPSAEAGGEAPGIPAHRLPHLRRLQGRHPDRRHATHVSGLCPVAVHRFAAELRTVDL